jgi:hypothetical protein
MSGTAGVGALTSRLPSECAVAHATPDAGVLATTLKSETIVELESQVITPVLLLNAPSAKSALEFTRARIAGEADLPIAAKKWLSRSYMRGVRNR